MWGVPGKPGDPPFGTLQVLRLAELDKLDLIRAHGLLGANDFWSKGPGVRKGRCF